MALSFRSRDFITLRHKYSHEKCGSVIKLFRLKRRLFRCFFFFVLTSQSLRLVNQQGQEKKRFLIE